MIVLDTNVLLRYLLNDEPKQAERARRLMESASQLTVTPTIVLELVWVLECSDCSRAEIVAALRQVFGLPAMRLSCLNGACALHLPAAWLNANPLTQAALDAELRTWRDVAPVVGLSELRKD